MKGKYKGKKSGGHYHHNNNSKKGKSEMCKFFLQGNCRKGNSCNFSHDGSNGSSNKGSANQMGGFSSLGKNAPNTFQNNGHNNGSFQSVGFQSGGFTNSHHTNNFSTGRNYERGYQNQNQQNKHAGHPNVDLIDGLYIPYLNFSCIGEPRKAPRFETDYSPEELRKLWQVTLKDDNRFLEEQNKIKMSVYSQQHTLYPKKKHQAGQQNNQKGFPSNNQASPFDNQAFPSMGFQNNNQQGYHNQGFQGQYMQQVSPFQANQNAGGSVWQKGGGQNEGLQISDFFHSPPNTSHTQAQSLQSQLQMVAPQVSSNAPNTSIKLATFMKRSPKEPAIPLDYTQEDLLAFQRDKFEEGKIPLLPPREWLQSVLN